MNRDKLGLKPIYFIVDFDGFFSGTMRCDFINSYNMWCCILNMTMTTMLGQFKPNAIIYSISPSLT